MENDRGLRVGSNTRTRSGAWTMRILLHVPLWVKLVSFHMVKEVTVRKEDTLGRRQVKSHEGWVASVAASPTRKVTDVFWDKFHGFVTLLLRQVRYVDQRLKCRTVFNGLYIDVRAR